MPIGRAHAVALVGIDGAVVEIEADISAQLPNFILIGLPDAALGEARDRVRAAAANAGIPLTGRRLTINLSPASLPKHGSGFDLGIALAAFAADGQVSAQSVAAVVHLGELGLDGRVRPVPGILPAVLAAVRAGFDTVVVPAGNAGEARLVPDVRVVGVASLREAAIFHGAELEPVEVEPLLPVALAIPVDEAGDLADVIGNPDAVEAMQVAAAGGHHVFLLGPPGAGKTMLASRLPSLLPDLSPREGLEVSSIRSLVGMPVGSHLARRPPLEAPHHTASAAAIVGGGSGLIRPGAAARAAHGVLFLDEAPEFAAASLDALRQPLESGVITISRASGTARFPARFQLVLAANPCPCGNYGVRGAECTCSPNSRRRYLARLSGPLLDRVDIQQNVHRVTAAQMRAAKGADRPDSSSARARIAEARARAAARLRETPWRLNSHVPGSWLRTAAGVPQRGATTVLDRALETGGITMRGYDRVLKLNCISLGHTCSMATIYDIYARQSLDITEGITRQVERCTQLIEARGGVVGEVYRDNDTSASKTRGPKTAWGKMLAADPRPLVAVDLDRLLRTITDLTTIIATGRKVVTVDGEIDLTTADGEFRATMLAGIARFEVRRKAERQRRANGHRRGLGVPAGGRRAFGYTPLEKGAASTTATRRGAAGVEYPAYGHQPLEPEATAVRRGYDMLLAGATLRSIARAWNEDGLTTTVGHSWEPYGVRGVLANPRYAALVAPPRDSMTATSLHNLSLGDLPAGSWEPLVTPATWAAARDLLVDPARRTSPGAVPKSLLSGLAVCGVCGAPMKAGVVRGIQVYRCGVTPHLARKRADADHYITEVVVERLSRPDARDLLADRDAPDVDALRAELREAQQGEANVLSMVSRGLTSMRAAEASLRDVRKRIGELDAAMSDAGKVDVLGPLVTSSDVRAVWDGLDGDRQRAVVRALIGIEMRSPGKGSRAPRDGAGRLAHTAATMPLTWH